MSFMRVVQVSRPGSELELVERAIPSPAHGEALVKVQACGICHSDLFVKEGLFPGIEYPRVPGHEVAGVIEDVGPGVRAWKTGQRVGVGWHGGDCFQCTSCRVGDFIACENAKITGISFDGGYAEYMLAPQEALALIPEELNAVEAAPLLCAGITSYNALRNSGARAGDVVGILGLGGLGHLGIQYAKKLGLFTVALSSGADKETLASRLGADRYIDMGSTDAASELMKLGGARVILATAPDSEVMSRVVEGLSVNGMLLVVGASADPIQVSPVQLISRRRSIQGWTSGHAKDSGETLHFSKLSGVRAMVEPFPLEKASEAFARMMANKVRFRAVLTMDRKA